MTINIHFLFLLVIGKLGLKQLTYIGNQVIKKKPTALNKPYSVRRAYKAFLFSKTV